MIQKFVGMWALKRAYRLLTADDPRPLRERLTREAKRVLVAALVLLGVLVVGGILLIAVVIAALT